jgi:hypothetical protein
LTMYSVPCNLPGGNYMQIWRKLTLSEMFQS